MPDGPSIVFVVDDDVSERDSLELSTRTAGLAHEVFESASHSYPARGSVLPGARRDASLAQRSGAAEAARERTDMPMISQ
jgi:FixJ family two-component response regulator